MKASTVILALKRTAVVAWTTSVCFTVAKADQLSDDVLQEAMREAEVEYAQSLSASDAKGTHDAPFRERFDAGAVAPDKTSGLAALEELAATVDTLKNKVAIERATLLATQSPRKVRMRGAKTVFNYQEGAVYEITAALDHVTDVQLRPGETLTTPPTSGDTVRWNVGVMKSGAQSEERTHIIIKPLDDDLQTNLIITTDQHTYQLKLKSGDFLMPAVSWNYPDDHDANILAALKKQEAEEATIRPELLRFNYEIDGRNYKWKPLRVFDDGRKTFIQMPRDMRVTEAPVLFILEDGSEPLLANYRVKSDFYIVDRLFERAELRVGPENSVTISLDDDKGFFARLFD